MHRVSNDDLLDIEELSDKITDFLVENFEDQDEMIYMSSIYGSFINFFIEKATCDEHLLYFRDSLITVFNHVIKLNRDANQ